MFSLLKKVWLVFVLACFTSTVTGQYDDDSPVTLLSPEVLKNLPVYTDVEDALRDANMVYKLDLSNRGMADFPREVFKMPELSVLILNGNLIREIPSEIKKLKKLQVVSLTRNRLNKLPPEFYQLTNLVELNLNYNRIETISSDIGYLSKLRWLKLAHNRLDSLPEDIGFLPELEELTLNDNRLPEVFEAIYGLSKLRVLPLNNNRITIFRGGIADLQNLEELYLENNFISSLPEDIGELQNLKRLIIDNNELTDLNSNIGYLKNLEYLSVRNNKIKNFPDLGECVSLQTIDASDNLIEDVAGDMNALVSLEAFFLDSSKMKIIPETMLQVQKKGVLITGLKNPVDFDGIEAEISDSISPYFYQSLMKKYLKNSEFLNAEEYKHLYYGYVFQETYKPNKNLGLEYAFYEALSHNFTGEVRKFGKKIIRDDFFNIKIIYHLYKSYEGTKKTEHYLIWKHKYYGLIEAIKASGDGQTIKSAYKVINTRDEQALLKQMGLKIRTQSLLNNKFDILMLKPNELGISMFYFDVRKPMEKLAERL
ncbi:MAG: hypothetical protein COA57_05835 [Flavobacteriales bacterium]|nr:MAG: hypothetical protein COA57_05835 [Flavobacteriales bacterium]